MGQLVIPLVVGMATVIDHDTVGRECQHTASFDVGGLALGEGDELRQIAVMVQAYMQLDGALAGAETCPGKQAQTQIHGRGIQRIELVPEPETMARRHRLAACQQLSKQGLVQGIGLVLVDSGEIRA